MLAISNNIYRTHADGKSRAYSSALSNLQQQRGGRRVAYNTSATTSSSKKFMGGQGLKMYLDGVKRREEEAHQKYLAEMIIETSLTERVDDSYRKQ